MLEEIASTSVEIKRRRHLFGEGIQKDCRRTYEPIFGSNDFQFVFDQENIQIGGGKRIKSIKSILVFLN